jgi:hypothetical protein
MLLDTGFRSEALRSHGGRNGQTPGAVGLPVVRMDHRFRGHLQNGSTANLLGSLHMS